MRSPACRLLSVCFYLLFISNAFAETLRIGIWDRDANRALPLTSEAILTQAYAELNQPVEFIDLPIRRALDMLLKGQLDGNFYRTAEIGQQYPMLFRVETPLNIAEVRMYRNNTKINPKNWAQLQNLRVGYLRGTLMIERQLRKLYHQRRR